QLLERSIDLRRTCRLCKRFRLRQILVTQSDDLASRVLPDEWNVRAGNVATANNRDFHELSIEPTSARQAFATSDALSAAENAVSMRPRSTRDLIRPEARSSITVRLMPCPTTVISVDLNPDHTACQASRSWGRLSDSTPSRCFHRLVSFRLERSGSLRFLVP